MVHSDAKGARVSPAAGADRVGDRPRPSAGTRALDLAEAVRRSEGSCHGRRRPVLALSPLPTTSMSRRACMWIAPRPEHRQ